MLFPLSVSFSSYHSRKLKKPPVSSRKSGLALKTKPQASGACGFVSFCFYLLKIQSGRPRKYDYYEDQFLQSDNAAG
jgi:hypothetical protein